MLTFKVAKSNKNNHIAKFSLSPLYILGHSFSISDLSIDVSVTVTVGKTEKKMKVILKRIIECEKRRSCSNLLCMYVRHNLILSKASLSLSLSHTFYSFPSPENCRAFSEAQRWAVR